MSSGGGSTQTQVAELPSWLQDAAQENLGRARMTADIGYVPQYGLDVAGFTPMQTSAMQNTANAASAFGLAAPTNAMAGMPAQQTNNLGFSGYSSGALFDDALSQLQANRPAQYDYMNSMFIDPMTGGASAPSILELSKTNPTEALNQAMSRYNQDPNAGAGDFVPMTPEEAYYNSLSYLDPQNPIEEAIKFGLSGPFGVLDKFLFTPLHQANVQQFENKLGWNEPYGDTSGVKVIDDTRGATDGGTYGGSLGGYGGFGGSGIDGVQSNDFGGTGSGFGGGFSAGASVW